MKGIERRAGILELNGNPEAKHDNPARIRDAAEQFEALLLEQIFKSVRESGGGWLGSGSGSGGDCAIEFAEQQMAIALAQRGGLGLAAMVRRGLQK